LENLRPEAFLGSMLIRPSVTGGVEIPVLMDETDEENAVYILLLMRKAPNGDLVLSRDIWFDRTDLSIIRQKMYDDAGVIVSDTRYGKWQVREGALFPGHIDINRPKDGYGVVMDVLDVKMNIPLTEDKFILEQPAGTTLQVLGNGGAGTR